MRLPIFLDTDPGIDDAVAIAAVRIIFKILHRISCNFLTPKTPNKSKPNKK